MRIDRCHGLTYRYFEDYTYTAKEWDKETGLYYYRARYYDPSIGRFIQKDPIGFRGGDVNLYGYVHNNAVNRKDPFGLFDAGLNDPPTPTDPIDGAMFPDCSKGGCFPPPQDNLYCAKVSGIIGACLDTAAIGATLSGAGAGVGWGIYGLSVTNTAITLKVCSHSPVGWANAITSVIAPLLSKSGVTSIATSIIDAHLSLGGMN